MNKPTKTFHIGDTVYIPARDPDCSTIYYVEAIKKSHIEIYHPNTGFLEVQPEELEDSIY